MQKSLPLLRGSVTFSAALDDDDNVLQELAYPELRIQFCTYLLVHRAEIERIVSYHLGLSRKQECRIGEVKEWIAGGFNICIPVYFNKGKAATERVLIRFPLPYKIGESQYPGNADEKLRAEAATFIWIKDKRLPVPIPRLRGFGFASGQQYTAIEDRPYLYQLIWRLRRFLAHIFGYHPPSPYRPVRGAHRLTTGYLLMDYVERTDGAMLSETWDELRHDQNRRKNLFRGLSRIILAMANTPFDRIGSLTIDDSAHVRLTNRPLTLRLQHLENESVPTNINRNLTYTTTDAYLSDLLACHDNRLRTVPNSIRDRFDGQAQLSVLTTMRALLPHFTSRSFRHGPFVLSLTDLSQNNIFVDGDWNITCLVDLEWTCSLPGEMLNPPYWLTSRGVDQLNGEHLEPFNKLRTEFMDVFEEEEQSQSASTPHNLTEIMNDGWKTGKFWYFHALDSPKGLYNIFLNHIQPLFTKLDDKGMDEFERTLAPYWTTDVQGFLDDKVRQKEKYDEELRQAFSQPEAV
ncbi:hypothetical protein BJX70DRAFT_271919 [Aspergillus crustosus]